jgi:hypothetical protein
VATDVGAESGARFVGLVVSRVLGLARPWDRHRDLPRRKTRQLVVLDLTREQSFSRVRTPVLAEQISCPAGTAHHCERERS